MSLFENLCGVHNLQNHFTEFIKKLIYNQIVNIFIMNYLKFQEEIWRFLL